MGNLFGGATAEALKAVFDARSDGDKGCITVGTFGNQPRWLTAHLENQAAVQAQIDDPKNYEMRAMTGAIYATQVAAQAVAWEQLRASLIDSPHLYCITSAPAPVAKKATVCECGVKFTGGLHSDWCPCHAA